MKRHNALWFLAQACWMSAVLSFFLPGVAKASVIDTGRFNVTFNELATLMAIGFAWGDMRQWRSQVEKRLEKLEG